MEKSLNNMQDSKEQQRLTKLDNLYTLFPHVNCDEVKDIFDGVQQNI